MTHDELLAEINKELEITHWEAWHEGARALLAVVELHKPKVESDLNDYLICEECTEISWRNEKWPCHTVKAIEEALQ